MKYLKNTYAPLDKLLFSYVKSNKLAGASVLICSANKRLHFKKFGYQDTENKTTIAENTLFRIYSMTKPITSIALMQLWEKSLFNLDDPIGKYIPNFENTQVLLPNGSRIPSKTQMTIRHVLCHTAGITLPAFSDDHLVPLYLQYQIDGMRSKGNLKHVIETLGSLPVKFEPGSQWAYSMATDIAGYLVEILSGTAFPEYLTNHIFTPLGMKDTSFSLAPKDISRFATNYGIKEGTIGDIIDAPSNSTYLKEPEFPAGSGGLISTAADYENFMQMLLQNGQFGGQQILKAPTLRMMTRNHLNGDLEDMGANHFNDEDWSGIGFGLGFSVVIDETTMGIPKATGEYGWSGAAGTYFLINPAHDFAAMLLTQYMPSSAYPLRREFREAVYQSLF